ncbi:MAG: phosphoribosylamine--glycine ligase [Ignavibacteria bacterium]|nr:phosphoribosylamine--glycine ligase [Ignavibacteria bacterium]
MNVLLIGNGGREHAIAYKLSESKSLKKLYIIPGNPGTASCGENVNLKTDKDIILSFCKDKNIDLVVIGPEQPLVDGLSDFLLENGFKVFGPSAKASQIEGDKVFSKNLMKKYKIPTAAFEVFKREEKAKAEEYIRNSKFPLVLKAYGLAAGKGVLICNNFKEAVNGLKLIFEENAFGDAGEKIVIEEFMQGEEASVFAITDGNDFITLPAAQDHKRIYDNDEGKNTGGMGSYAPAPVITEELQKEINDTVILPTLKAMEAEGCKFSGCLYCGLMITTEGPKVVEFNCRFGDPEAQVVLPILQGDFLKLLISAAEGKLDKSQYKYENKSAVCVVAASAGYPDLYKKGYEITGLEKKLNNIIVFQAGTKSEGDKIVTSGGRVLGITAVCDENNIPKCKIMAYEAIKNINFEGMQFRSDISDKALKHLK